MSLTKRFQEKYGKSSYERNFSRNFREAVKNIDSITKIVSKVVREEKEEKK